MSGIRSRAHRVRVEDPGDVRFLTFSCFGRLPLFLNDSIKARFVERLSAARDQHGFALLGWVIMPEHVHLLLWPKLPSSPVNRILRSLKQPFAQEVLERFRERNAPVLPRLIDSRGVSRFWLRGGGYDRNIRSDQEFIEKIEYIHNNPVRRGLVATTTDWPWSSARWYGGLDALLTIDPLRRPL